jgi:hypothetical protein
MTSKDNETDKLGNIVVEHKANEPAFFHGNVVKMLDKKVFVSISSEDPKELIIDPTRALVDSLKSRKYKGLELIYECYENETHFSGYPNWFKKDLRKLNPALSGLCWLLQLRFSITD